MQLFKYYFEEIKSEFKMLRLGVKYVFSKKKRAIYVGCLGNYNLGDKAVFIAIREMLKSRFFLYQIPYGKPFSGKIFRKYFFNEPDYIILGGGTLVLKSADESFLRIVLKYRNQYPNAQLVVFGTGVADPVLADQNGFPTNIYDWYKFLILCKFIFVRGVLSKKMLESKKWNIENEIKILHDPAMFFLNKKIMKKNMNKTIGLNFCDISGRIYGRDQKALGEFFKKLVEKLLLQDWNIYLYPTVNTDIQFMKNQLGDELFNQVSIYENCTNLEESLNFFKEIDVFVGQRLHSIIFSAITYTPFYAIEYESKMSDFLLTLGVKDKSMRTDNLALDSLLISIMNLYHNIENEQSILFDLVSKSNQEQLNLVDEFLIHA